MLTTIIRTKNSEETISEVLESVKDLGEIIVIDEHSTDDTVLISKEYKANILYSYLIDFKENFIQAVSDTQNDWIMFLEGDEIVPEKLGNLILNYIENPKKNKNVVVLSQKLFCFNKEIKAARKKEVKVFKKDCAEFDDNYNLQLKPKKSKVYKINKGFKNDKNCVLKFEKRNIFTLFKDNIEEIILKSKEENISSSVFIKPFFRFLNLYIFKRACFQGRVGFIYSANEMFKKYIFECAKFEKRVK